MTEHTSGRSNDHPTPRAASAQRGHPPARRRGGRHRRPALPEAANLRLLWAGQFINTAGLMMLVPIMPFYLQRMGLSGPVAVQGWAGVAIAAPALALVVVTPLWGKLGDRIGRKWMVVRALAGLAAAMVVMATATTPLTLVIGRLLQGTLGGVVEAAAGFASTSGAKGSRGATLGKSFSATAAGSLIGPIAGGTLVGSGQLSVLMITIAAAATALAITCAIGLREPPREPPGGTPVPVPPPGTPRPRPSRALAPSVAVAAVAAYLGVYGLIPVFAEYTQTLVTPDRAGLWVGIAQSLTWGATLVSSPWWGRRNDSAGRPLAIFALAAGGCGLAIIAQSLPLGLPGILGLRLIQGACFAALAQSLFFHVSSTARADRGAGAVGAANSFLLAGQSIGPLLAGPLVSALPLGAVIALLGASCLLAAALAARASTPPPTGSATAPTTAPSIPVDQRATWNDPAITPLDHISTVGRPGARPRSISRHDLVSLGREQR